MRYPTFCIVITLTIVVLFALNIILGAVPIPVGDIIHILRSGSCIVTTAKDYARLLSAGLPPELVQHIIVQEVGIGILFNQENEFLSCLERFKKPHRGC